MTRIPVSRRTIDALVEDGALLFEQSDVGGALQCWKEALDMDPGHAGALAWLDYLERELTRRALAAEAASTPPPSTPAGPVGPARRASAVPAPWEPVGGLPLPELEDLPSLEPLPDLDALPELEELPSFDELAADPGGATGDDRPFADSYELLDEDDEEFDRPPQRPPRAPELDEEAASPSQTPASWLAELDREPLPPSTTASYPPVQVGPTPTPSRATPVVARTRPETAPARPLPPVAPAPRRSATPPLPSAVLGRVEPRAVRPDLSPTEDGEGYLDLGPLEFVEEEPAPRPATRPSEPVDEHEALLIEFADEAEEFSDLTDDPPVGRRAAATPPPLRTPAPTPAAAPAPTPAAAPAPTPAAAPTAAGSGLRPRSLFPEPPPDSLFAGTGRVVPPPAHRSDQPTPPAFPSPVGAAWDDDPDAFAYEAPPRAVTPVDAEPAMVDADAWPGDEAPATADEEPLGNPWPADEAEPQREPTEELDLEAEPPMAEQRYAPVPVAFAGLGEAERPSRPDIALERPFASAEAVGADAVRGGGERLRTPPPDDPMVRARAALLQDDLEAAFNCVSEALHQDTDDRLAQALQDEIRDQLVARYLSAVGGRGSVVQQRLSRTDLMRLPLDHRAGFVLSWVDGRTSVDDILDLSGMEPLETLKILAQLAEQGVVEAR